MRVTKPTAVLSAALLATTLAIGGSAAADAAAAKYTLQVTGTGTATNVTVLVDGDITQKTNAKLPYSKKVSGSANIYGVTAQAGASGKSITCIIKNGSGKVVKKKTSSGAYAVVNCSYTKF